MPMPMPVPGIAAAPRDGLATAGAPAPLMLRADAPVSAGTVGDVATLGIAPAADVPAVPDHTSEVSMLTPSFWVTYAATSVSVTRRGGL